MADINDSNLILSSKYNYSRLDTIFKKNADEEKFNEFENNLSKFDGIKDFCKNFTSIFSTFNDFPLQNSFENHECPIVKNCFYYRILNLSVKRNKGKNISNVISSYNCPINMKYYIDVNDGLCEKVKEECESLNPKITYCGPTKIFTISIISPGAHLQIPQLNEVNVHIANYGPTYNENTLTISPSIVLMEIFFLYSKFCSFFPSCIK
ncbi:PIR Superfamily Protein [Plasmodium ovale curtisi]|uniref:PIR Superfamily Protein n=1 Tax=Plasmodium ovale curtisi TaxID=864141 RepID=A0A1A8X166_PLAOA|nr:PIR Superfamily Protein [Plasmodium ovale curtisi]